MHIEISRGSTVVSLFKTIYAVLLKQGLSLGPEAGHKVRRVDWRLPVSSPAQVLRACATISSFSGVF